MLVLSPDEAVSACDAFLLTVYGAELMDKWIDLKSEMEFVNERDFMAWLLELAREYRHGNGDQLAREYRHGNGDQLAREYRHGNAHQYPPPLDDAGGDANLADVSVTSCGDQSEFSDEIDPAEVDDMKPGDITFNDQDFSDISCIGEDSYNLDTSLHSSDGSCTGVAGDPGCASSRRHVCPYCPYSSKDKGNLQQHVTAVHEKKKPFSCPHCDYAASLKTNVKQHLILKHGYSSPYNCERCGRSFPSRMYQQRHVGKCLVPPE